MKHENPSPTFCQVCGVSRGMKMNDLGTTSITSSPSLTLYVPSRVYMNSSCSRCTCNGGPSPGAEMPSITVRPPPLCSLTTLNVVTPPTGFSTDVPSPGASANGLILWC